MKPFRGKPEKPERSNGEIHSRLDGEARCQRDGRSPGRPRLSPHLKPANACTSPPVGRRDPLGAGLRPAVETRWRTFASRRRDPRCSRPARPTVDRWRWAATSVRVRPAASAPCVSAIGPGADPEPRRLFAAVLSDRLSRNADLRRRSFGYFQDPS